ncbi:hypothetical protein HK097_008695 [Rhizophlyctis rosea]|uniref:Uncharacterized protein n=1 Tax=Rhizophlyctis rosea TaxID=64517 RepID=A0AAD5X1J7_9FUNG|nr:hypothetical protein HK097_008695 [Rhizophlyctis rosea]
MSWPPQLPEDVSDKVASTASATASAPPRTVASGSEAPASISKLPAKDAAKLDDNNANQESGKAVERDLEGRDEQSAEEAPSQLIEQEGVIRVPKKEREIEHEIDDRKREERLKSVNDDRGEANGRDELQSLVDEVFSFREEGEKGNAGGSEGRRGVTRLGVRLVRMGMGRG